MFCNSARMHNSSWQANVSVYLVMTTKQKVQQVIIINNELMVGAVSAS